MFFSIPQLNEPLREKNLMEKKKCYFYGLETFMYGINILFTYNIKMSVSILYKLNYLYKYRNKLQVERIRINNVKTISQQYLKGGITVS